MAQQRGQVIDPNEWEDYNPEEWEDVDPTPSPVQQPERSFLGRMWDTISQPLITAPSEWARAKATEMTDPNNKPGWLTGFAAGALEGTGDLLSGLTSPVNIAATAASGGAYGAARAGLPAAARGLTNIARLSAVPVALHGASTITDPEASWGERAIGLAELAGGAAGAMQPVPRPRTATPIPNPTTRVAPALAEAAAPEVPSGPRVNPALAESATSRNPVDIDISTTPRSGPRGEGYRERVLADSGEGKPGLSVEERPDPMNPQGTRTHVVYRAHDGQPVASAILQRTEDGRLAVGNIAAAEGRGMLTGRAVKAIGDKLVEMDAARPYAGISPDAERMILKATGQEPPRRTIVHNPDGTVTIKDAQGNTVATVRPKNQSRVASQPEVPASAMVPELPSHLRGAKPRYNMGGTSYTPIFANDLDKAMYIIAQTKKSLRDSEYLQYVTDATGMTENQARTAAIEMRNTLKNALRGQPAGEVKLPKLFNPEGNTPPVPATTPEVPPQLAASGKGSGKPPLEPPPPNAVPDPVPASPNAEPILIRMRQKEYPEAGIVRQAWNLSRGMVSVDLPFISSAGLRQGFRYIGTKNWFKAWIPSMRAYGSKKFYEAHQQMLQSDPLMQRPIVPVMKADGTQLTRGSRPVYKETKSIAERAGIELTDLKNHSSREETIRSQLAERIPVWGRVVAASNRAYTAYINDLRLNAFRNLYEAMPDKNNEVALRQLGDAVNAFTGRGKLALEIPKSTTYFGREVRIPGGGRALSAERHANALAELLFSPRLMASRMQMLNPANYILAQPQVRKEYLKAAVRMAGAWFTMAKIGELAGAEVSLDPTNPDFGKVKIGNIRLDPAAGFQQFLVLMSKLGTGEATSSTSGRTRTLGEGYRPDTRGSIIQQFLENKLHPSAKFFYDALFAQQGRPFRVGDRTAQLFIPMISDDLLQIAQENPELLPFLAPLMSGGMGSQIYSGKEDFGEPGTPGKIMESMGIPDIVIKGR